MIELYSYKGQIKLYSNTEGPEIINMKKKVKNIF